MPLARSFERVDTNQKAICEKGWFPYNRNLLTYPSIRSNMTPEEISQEQTSTSVTIPQHALVAITDLVNSELTPSHDPQFLQLTNGNETESKAKLNFHSGMAAFVLDSIVMEADKHEARERIKVSREEGKTIDERIQDLKNHRLGGSS